MKKLNVAIIGYGRSGCDIHGAFLKTPENDICNVVAVVENDPPAQRLRKRISAATPTIPTPNCSTAKIWTSWSMHLTQICTTRLPRICWSMDSMFCVRNLCAKHRRWFRI